MATTTVYDISVLSLGNFKRIGNNAQQALIQCTPPNIVNFNPITWFNAVLANLNWGNPSTPFTSVPIIFADPITYITLQVYNVTSITNNSLPTNTCTLTIASPATFSASQVGAVVFYIQSDPRVIDTTPPVVYPDKSIFTGNAISTPNPAQLQDAWNAANTN